MVVMNPDQISRAVAGDDRLTEESVRLDVGLPVRRVEFQLRGKVVKDGPERLVCVTFVESCGHVLRQLDRETAVRFCPSGQYRLALLAVFRAAVSGPADPLATGPGEHRVHGARQSSGA